VSKYAAALFVKAKQLEENIPANRVRLSNETSRALFVWLKPSSLDACSRIA
jgi:hypothetical protein